MNECMYNDGKLRPGLPNLAPDLGQRGPCKPINTERRHHSYGGAGHSLSCFRAPPSFPLSTGLAVVFCY